MQLLASILDVPWFDAILSKPGRSGVALGVVLTLVYVLKQKLWPPKGPRI